MIKALTAENPNGYSITKIGEGAIGGIHHD